MNRPFRENLEIVSDAEGRWLRCVNCERRLCSVRQDWKAAALRKVFPPTDAGPLMKLLEGRYLLEKIYCPDCGALFNAAMVEDKQDD